MCLVVSEVTYADGWTDREASRDEGRQTQHSVVLMHFVQITHKYMLIILCLFGFPDRREVDPCYELYVFLMIYINRQCRSQWPRGLRRRSTAARSLRLWVRIPPEAWMLVCCECCVLSGRGLCDGLITRPEESYRLWRVVCDHVTSNMRRLEPATRALKIQPSGF